MTQNLTVIMYHYVRDFARTRFPGIRGLDLAAFKRQLDYLQEKYNIVTMPEVINALRGSERLPPRAALLTFDDGYAEHYQLVFPELHERKLAGCFYAPVAAVRDQRLLDVNRIHFILAATLTKPDEVSKLIDCMVAELQGMEDIDTVEAYRAAWAVPNRFDDAETVYIKRMLQAALPPHIREALSKELFARFVTVDEASFASELYMTEDQAKVMQSCGMSFGSHGAEHVWLNRLTRDEQIVEIEKSVKFLREIGVSVDDGWAMCYPYGAWDASLLSLLQDRACAVGFTTRVALAKIGEEHPLLLPRYDTNDFPQ